MSSEAAKVLGLAATQGQNCASNGFAIGDGQLVAGKDNLGEEEAWIGRVRANLGLAASAERGVDPGGFDDRDHHGHGFVIFREVDRVGNNMCAVNDGYGVIFVSPHDLCAVALDCLA